MSVGKDKGKMPERHSTRKGAGTINKLTYSKPGTNGGTRLSMPRTSTTGEAVVISSDEEENTTSVVAAGGSAVASASMAAVVAGLQPPPPGMVRARVAALEGSTGVVANRTFPLRVRTEVVNAETQTDDMVLWSCHSCSQKK